jgi:F420-0:gamma-glutamyl ligase
MRLLGALAPKTEDGRIVGAATTAVSAAEERMNSRRESEPAVWEVFITESPKGD